MLEQRLGRREHGDAAGHFRHRGQQRQAALGVGHGFIGDGRAAALEQAFGLGRIGRQVQIGEEDVARLQLFPLDLLRLLDLHDHVRAGEHRVGVGDDARARLDVDVVGIAGAEARARLDDDGVAVADIFTDGGGGKSDPVFARFDLGRDANAHDVSSKSALRSIMRLFPCSFHGVFGLETSVDAGILRVMVLR